MKIIAERNIQNSLDEKKVKNFPEQSSADRSKGFMSYGLEEIYAILNVPIIWVCVKIHSTINS